MPLNDRLIEGKVDRPLPTRSAEGTLQPLRLSKRGEQLVQTLELGRAALADEGSYFVATNATPGTGLAGIAATGAFSDAESLLLLQNDNTEDSEKRIYLDYLRVLVTAAGTNGTNHRYVLKLDDSERYTSGGTAITPKNVNMESTEATGAQLYFGALITTAAGSNARLLSNGLIRSVITVVGDQYTFEFGGEQPSGGALAVAGTAIAHVTVRCPPVILGPGDSLVFSLHAASQTAASSYEFECGWWER